MSEITIILGSITKASRAKRILSGAGIKGEIVRSGRTDTGECTNGVRIRRADIYRAALALRNQGMEYSVENDIS